LDDRERLPEGDARKRSPVLLRWKAAALPPLL
jgi:hypothetical protein